MSFYNSFTHGMTPVKLTALEQARYDASYVAYRASARAMKAAFKAGKSIPEAQAEMDAAYNAVMAKGGA